jgi:hypothetical protein
MRTAAACRPRSGPPPVLRTWSWLVAAAPLATVASGLDALACAPSGKVTVPTLSLPLSNARASPDAGRSSPSKRPSASVALIARAPAVLVSGVWVSPLGTATGVSCSVAGWSPSFPVIARTRGHATGR